MTQLTLFIYNIMSSENAPSAKLWQYFKNNNNNIEIQLEITAK